jgi:hypothetical protein
LIKVENSLNRRWLTAEGWLHRGCQTVSKTVLDDIVFVPLHHQVMVWAMRDQLTLPIDPQNFPRFRLARLNE